MNEAFQWNFDDLVEMAVTGAVSQPSVRRGGYTPWPDGVGVMLPGVWTRPMASGCYDVGHVEFTSAAVLTNRPPTSAYRGAGRAPYVNAVERAVDRFAAEMASYALGLTDAAVEDYIG